MSSTPASAARDDPKDRREIAARIAEVASGELQGPLLERALRDIVRDDPGNPQANLRLRYVLLESDRCAEAVKRFALAIAGHLPGADAYLSRAQCEVAAKNVAAARRSLNSALTAEPDNPSSLRISAYCFRITDSQAPVIPPLQRALEIDPNVHQARFSLANRLRQGQPTSRRRERSARASSPSAAERAAASRNRTPARRAVR